MKLKQTELIPRISEAFLYFDIKVTFKYFIVVKIIIPLCVFLKISFLSFCSTAIVLDVYRNKT